MIHFQMTKITVPQFAILADKVPPGKIAISTGIKFQFTHDMHRIACITKFTFSESGHPFMMLETRCEFSILPEDSEKMIKDGKPAPPKDFLKHLAMHSVGTARGILAMKTEGTQFTSMILPPINVDKILESTPI